MGGGRKKSSKKYYFLKGQKDKYHIHNDNLELSTILECIWAAGDFVPPSFCLQNGSVRTQPPSDNGTSRPGLANLPDSLTLLQSGGM